MYCLVIEQLTQKPNISAQVTMLKQFTVFKIRNSENIQNTNCYQQGIENKVLDVLSKIDVFIDPVNVEACHWLKFRNSDKQAKHA